jgi:hypothetical protein
MLNTMSNVMIFGYYGVCVAWCLGLGGAGAIVLIKKHAEKLANLKG